MPERTITGERVQSGPESVEGWVYVIECEMAIKIGWTQDPVGRMAWYRRNVDRDLHIWAIFEGTRGDERRLQEHYGHLLMRGEWFRVDPEILEDCDEDRVEDFAR